MNFPGDNTITLTRETVQEIVRDYVAQLIGDKARITATFTTDPEETSADA